MAFQAVPDCAEITVRYTLEGADVVNTYHAQASGGYDQTDLDLLAAAVDEFAVPGLLADQATALSYQRTDVRGLNDANDLTASADAFAGVGAVNFRPLPPQVTFCVQRLSGLTGRSARGRVYVAGIPTSTAYFLSATFKHLSAVARTAYVAHIDDFRIVINSNTPWTAVIVSRYSEGAKRAVGVAFPWVSTSSADNKLDTLRKRTS